MIEYLENRITTEIIEELRESVGWSQFSRGQMQSAVNQTAYSIIACSDHKPVGMGRLVGDGIYYLICDVIVKPDFQRQKIGTEIMNGIIRHVKKSLKSGEKCSVQIISAQGKEDFYRKIGFSSIPNEKSGHGMQLLISAQEKVCGTEE